MKSLAKSTFCEALGTAFLAAFYLAVWLLPRKPSLELFDQFK